MTLFQNVRKFNTKVKILLAIIILSFEKITILYTLHINLDISTL